MMETLPKIEEVEQPPILETAEKELAKMNQEMGEFLGELDFVEKNTDDENLREQIKELKNEAKFSADWWAGNILAFTNLVVGDGINFPVMEKIKEANKKETSEEMSKRAKKELAENGITGEQAKSYIPANNIFLRGIVPIGYELADKIKKFVPNLIFGEKYNEWKGIEFWKIEDAWRLYLGSPQQNNTFEISNYQPGEEKGLEQASQDGYCYKIKDFWSVHANDISGWIQKTQKSSNGYSHEGGNLIMNFYSVHLGEDEKGKYIAYHDIWDLDVFPENEKGFFGKPFSIYDRPYYDPETYEPIYESDTK